MKLAVFDFDSTLMDGETIEYLAKEANIEQEVKQITDRAMQGELDCFESLQTRVSLLKGLKVETVNRICEKLPAMPGVEETIKVLHQKGFKVICFSGGFKNATLPFAKKFGIDCEFSNILHSKDGILTGLVGGEMMFSDSKGEMLKRIQNLLNITPENTIATGDGANDLSMFKYAQKKIAFCAKPILKQHANIIIEKKDLREILNHI